MSDRGYSGGGTPVGVVLAVRKSADESVTNSSVLQDDDELSVVLPASSSWIVRVVMFAVAAASNSPDLQFQLTGPSGATAVLGKHGLDTGATSTAGTPRYTGAQAFSSNATNALMTNATMVVLEGSVVIGSTAGAVTLQWAQSSATPAEAITMKAGSYISFMRIA